MAIESISPVGIQAQPSYLARLSSAFGAKVQNSLSQLSSGMRITSPAVDAAGLAQSIQFEAELGRIAAAQSNIANASSFAETQQGALQGVTQAMERMSELSIRAQDITVNAEDRAGIQAEFSRLQDFISDTSRLQFNQVDLFSSQNREVTVDADANVLTMKGADLAAPGDAGGLGDVMGGAAVDTPAKAASARQTLETAVANVANIRANITASAQQMDVSAANLSVLSINLNAANGRIVDAGFPRAAVQFAGDKLLADSALLAFTKGYRFPRPGLSALA